MRTEEEIKKELDMLLSEAERFEEIGNLTLGWTYRAKASALQWVLRKKVRKNE